MDEFLQRFLLYLLIPLAAILSGSAWFALSILTYITGRFIPATRHQVPPLIPPRRAGDDTPTRPEAKPVVAPLPSILSTKNGFPQHHVKFPNTVPQPHPRRRKSKRWSSPAGFEVPHKPSEVLPTDEPITQIIDTQIPNVTPVNKLLPHLSHLERETHTPLSISSTIESEDDVCLSRTSSASGTRRSSISSKLPSMNIFRSRSKRVRGEGGHSRTGSFGSSMSCSPPSTPPVMVVDLKHDPEKGSTSTVSSGDFSKRFTAFRFGSNRASASSAMSAPDGKAQASEPLEAFHQTLSPPPSPDREVLTSMALPPQTPPRSRRKVFASYLNLSIHSRSKMSNVPHTASVDGTFPAASPSRPPVSALPPSTPKQHCFMKGKQSSKTLTSPAPVPRTQPYGYPYFAMMPTGEYAELPPELRKSERRRTFGGVIGSHSKTTSADGSSPEGKNQEATPKAPVSDNTLGLDLGHQQHTPRRKRLFGRRLASDGTTP